LRPLYRNIRYILLDMFLLRYLVVPKYYRCYIILLDESTKNMTIRVLLVSKNATIHPNIEYEAKYNYIASHNILELDTNQISPHLDYLPRIFQLVYYYDEYIKKTIYSLEYFVLPKLEKWNTSRILPAPTIATTVEFIANKEHVIHLNTAT